MGFMESLKDELNNEGVLTENGAVQYCTSGKELLDANFAVSSMRSWDEEKIKDTFTKVYFENKLLACKWLFYLRDVRGGLGERRSFRAAFSRLIDLDIDVAKKLLPLIPEYGRWDDLLSLYDTNVHDDVVSIVKEQLDKDLKGIDNKSSISLLGKWMFSINTSSRKTRVLAKRLAKDLGMTEKDYRKTVSKLRQYIDVIEVKMSDRQWGEIDYSKVPSRANLLYGNAFDNHDHDRRQEYLESLQRGGTKINAGTLFPHDIVHKYTNTNDWRRRINPIDVTTEELWKALPDYVNGNGNTICVADGSGSMNCRISDRSATTALDVANSLAIYFAEKCSGEFKDKYITFSRRPQLVDFSSADTLHQKIQIAMTHNEVANTNIEAVFKLILDTAVNNGMSQDDMPSNVLILSDMEFDGCACTNSDYGVEEKDFDKIAKKYEEKGYKLPRLVFWNICGRTNGIPIKQNDLGVSLVSGFSPAICNMVLSNETDPYVCLTKELNKERYQPVEDVLIA